MILSKYWPWGPNAGEFCRIIHSAPVTLVFMVSIIIIVIACDRYRCIVVRNQGSQVSYKHCRDIFIAKILIFLVQSYFYKHIFLNITDGRSCSDSCFAGLINCSVTCFTSLISTHFFRKRRQGDGIVRYSIQVFQGKILRKNYLNDIFIPNVK